MKEDPSDIEVGSKGPNVLLRIGQEERLLSENQTTELIARMLSQVNNVIRTRV
jgi:hypothetical protein